MGPKKNGKKKEKTVEEEGIGMDTVLSNFIRVSKTLSIVANPALVESINSVIQLQETTKLKQIFLDGSTISIKAGGIRALVLAILYGTGAGLTTGPYKLLQSFRLWRCSIGDDGMAAICELLVKGQSEIPLSYLELHDCKLGLRGCKDLSDALQTTVKLSKLLTLNLNYNSKIGDDGIDALSRGLSMSTTLKQLYLDYCGIGQDGATGICRFIIMPHSSLHLLSLQGNELSGNGLKMIAKAVRRSPCLLTLNIADNAYDQNLETIHEIRDMLLHSKVLEHVDFSRNPLQDHIAEELIPALTSENKRLRSFQVDANLSPEMFQKLNRAEKKEGKKKKGKGKKKK